MEKIQVFRFRNEQFGQVRVLEEDGKPLFCGSDVAKALGYSNPNKAINDHCRAITKRSTPVSGKIQEINFIPEGDVYRLITHSKLPTAERFESWVFDVVIPSIRKYGGYIAGQDTMSDADLMAKALLVAQRQIEQRDAQITEMQPKALFADAVSASKSSILIGELAKMLRQNGVDIGQNRLFEYLRENGYLCKSGAMYNCPTQRAMDMGLFEIKETAIQHADGHVTINRTPKVTGKGQVYFVNKLLGDREAWTKHQ